jgi:2-C-methyl-D-erythritol 4-phosphate cytidylyltransferase
MIQSKKVTVIIPAAGFGSRMQTPIGDRSKQFMTLRNKPLLAHTLEKFENSKYTDEIIVVCPDDGIRFVEEEVVVKFGFKKVSKIVVGGKQRQDSVYEGLKAVQAADMILVHDAVRPFISVQKIDELIETCAKCRAAILAVQPKDTVKLQDDDQYVSRSLDRTKLWNVQTPQAFEYALLQQAFQKAYAEKFYGTDEAMLVERLNAKIKIIPGDYNNIKITSPEDWALAEWLLNRDEI